MAAPAWRSVGTAASVTTAPATPGMPAGHTTNDILITATEADVSDSIGTDADYPHITGSPLSATATDMGVGWKRHDGSEVGPTWPAVTNHQHAICFAISGAITTGTPFDILSSGTIGSGSGTITIPAGTTLVDETLVVAITSRSNDSAAADFSAEACASLVSITEAYDAGTTSGGGGGLGVWYGVKAVAGAVGDITFTAGTTASRCYMVLGFRPPSGATQALTGSLFTKAPTFFTGAVTATYSLTGSLFAKAPTFFTGVVTPGVVTLTGTLFTKAPTFPTGVISQLGGPQSLSGVLFQKAPTFPTGTVTTTVALTGVLFQKAPTFPAGTIGQSGTIFGNLFVKAPTFFTGSLAQGGPSFWTPNPAAYVGVTRYGPSPWGAELSGQRFEKAPTFPVGAVS